MVFKSEVFEMSRNVKGKPIAASPADVAAAEAHQAQRAGNGQLQRNIAQAQRQELDNRRGEFNQGLADLKRATLRRDSTVAGRESYNNCYNRVTKIAQRLASIIGEGVAMPAWLPPPGQEVQQTVT